MTALRAGVLVVLCLAGCVPKDFGIFLPVKTSAYRFPGNHVPRELLEERSLLAADGVRVSAVLVRHELPASRPVLVYLHGQASNLDEEWGRIQILWDAGYEVLALDYRGFGTSDGEPSEDGLVLDARAALEAARADARLDPARIGIWGFSLGTGVAAALASGSAAQLLVLEAPFTSLAAMVEGSSPYAIPADWYTDVRFDTLAHLRSVAMPVVVAAGTEDRRVPAWMSERVFDAVPTSKRIVRVGGAGHTQILERGAIEILAAIAAVSPGMVP